MILSKFYSIDFFIKCVLGFLAPENRRFLIKNAKKNAFSEIEFKTPGLILAKEHFFHCSDQDKVSL